MRKILYIHGAFSSGLSFRRIQEKLPKHDAHFVEYTVDEPLTDVIARTQEIIKKEGPLDLVAHSLGGIIAVASAHEMPLVRTIATLSTPFGGSRVADVLKWISGHELYRSLTAQSNIIRDLQAKALHCPHRCIVTTVGNNPMMFEPNDGVVSLKSQMAMPNADIVQVPLNHFEVLLSDMTVKLIKEFTFK